jgi:hypothetical protein
LTTILLLTVANALISIGLLALFRKVGTGKFATFVEKYFASEFLLLFALGMVVTVTFLYG